MERNKEDNVNYEIKTIDVILESIPLTLIRLEPISGHNNKELTKCKIENGSMVLSGQSGTSEISIPTWFDLDELKRSIENLRSQLNFVIEKLNEKE